LKDVEKACGYLQRSSAMYHESGHGDTAGQVLIKAAKLVGEDRTGYLVLHYISSWCKI